MPQSAAGRIVHRATFVVGRVRLLRRTTRSGISFLVLAGRALRVLLFSVHDTTSPSSGRLRHGLTSLRMSVVRATVRLWQTFSESVHRVRLESAFSHVAIVPPGAVTIYVGGQNSVDAEGALVGDGDVAAQSVRAVANAKIALAAAGATLADVVHWTVLFVDGADLAAGYGAIAQELASDEPALVTAARVAGLGVPGASSRSARWPPWCADPPMAGERRSRRCRQPDAHPILPQVLPSAKVHDAPPRARALRR